MIDQTRGALIKGAVPGSDPGPPPAKPDAIVRPIQIVEVVPGATGSTIDLRCICRKLLFRWKLEDQADSGAVSVEIRCARCHTTTIFRLPFREVVDTM